MFYPKIRWFYRDYKSENLCLLNLYSVIAARILYLFTSGHVKYSQMNNETPLQLERVFLHAGKV